jgi:hypothetical protein
MREVYEFRLDNELASEFLPHGFGRRIGNDGGVRVVKVDRSDPLFNKIGQLEFRFKSKKKLFMSSWDARRYYTSAEISAAEFFTLSVDKMLSEDILGDYDDSSACQFCGAGGHLHAPLILKRARTYEGKKFDVARSLQEELIFSSRIVGLLKASRITGCEWEPVRVSRKDDAKAPDFFRLIVTGGSFEVVQPTRFGIDPFDPDVEGEYRCRMGHLYGLNLLSEIHFGISSEQVSDFMHSAGFVGNRSGELRASHIIVISARAASLLENAKSGVRLEIAHRVGVQRG